GLLALVDLADQALDLGPQRRQGGQLLVHLGLGGDQQRQARLEVRVPRVQFAAPGRQALQDAQFGRRQSGLAGQLVGVNGARRRRRRPARAGALSGSLALGGGRGGLL